MRRQIVLDTETTGLQPEDGHKIIEIGCVEIINRVITGNNYHKYLNPERVVGNEAIAIHGLTNDFLQDKPIFAEVADGFIEFIEGAELIIHNAPFDLGFLGHEFRMLAGKNNFALDDVIIIDTLPLARKMHPGQRNSLDALCKRYGVDNSVRDYHGALLDSLLLAEVYLRMTGGQGNLFIDEDVAHISSIEQQNRKKNYTKKNSPILYANDDELMEHKKYLDKIRKKSGKCLWNEGCNE